MSCNKRVQDKANTLSQADKILNKAIKAHGGKDYDNAHYKFSFRGKDYTFLNNNDQYTYTLSFEKDGKATYDEMTNDNFTRTINGNPVRLSQKQKNGYSESLNSVIYFATLPHKLQDKAVNKSYVGETRIKDINYHVLEISFDEEGGGKDFDDIYHYWINTDTNQIDYLAYNYSVNKGGVRFRSTYNKRKVGNIIFQDYINYKAEVGTPLADLPKMWEAGELKELSRIETENVMQLNK